MKTNISAQLYDCQLKVTEYLNIITLLLQKSHIALKLIIFFSFYWKVIITPIKPINTESL